MTLRSKALIAAFLAAGMLAVAALWFIKSGSTGMDAATREKLFAEIKNSRSEEPKLRLPRDWHACAEGVARLADEGTQRIECDTWTAQGVTSTLVALKVADALVPVVETRLEGTDDEGRIVVDVVGGPGGGPFQVDRGATDEFYDRLGEAGRGMVFWRDMRVSPYRYLMDRGFTIASVGYWGTNIRTLQAPNEIELAFEDVGTTVDFYRDRAGAEPALVTTSLGNHLALGALGRERLERMDVLAVVPVMDGLQHHLRRVRLGSARERAKAEADDELFGEWMVFNIYRRSGDTIIFDQSRYLPLHDYSPRYVGKHDLAWKDIMPKGKCSRILLGTIDPRTRDYLKDKKDLPSFVIVLPADHDLALEAPEDVRGLFFDYADCLARQVS